MVDDVHGRLDPVRSLLGREAGRWWWVPLVTGTAWFVIGWAVLRAEVVSLETVGLLVGFVFLGISLTEALLVWLFHGGWRVMHAVLAAVYLLGAGWAFVRPVDTFFALASVLGLLVLLQGFSSIAQAIGMRGVSSYWGLVLFSGILMTGLGLWISTSDRVWTLAARAAFVLLWVGFMAVFRGIQDVTIAFTILDASKQESRPQVSSAERPAVPQQRDASSRTQMPVRPGG